MEKPEMNRPAASCGTEAGTLPGACAPMVFPYVPVQGNNPVRFSRMEALQTGTLFPGLDLPFKKAMQAKNKLANTALVELMALDFAIDELGRLALHTRIEDMQTNEHAVTVEEVREIVDEAIESASRKTLRHFWDIVLHRRYDEEDMIILRERDFI